ncbi:hypothetical protein [Acidithiobacillus ferrivorans]|nr:hypothetical protein [Acidithiobacillus ferrivorans]
MMVPHNGVADMSLTILLLVVGLYGSLLMLFFLDLLGTRHTISREEFDEIRKTTKTDPYSTAEVLVAGRLMRRDLTIPRWLIAAICLQIPLTVLLGVSVPLPGYVEDLLLAVVSSPVISGPVRSLLLPAITSWLRRRFHRCSHHVNSKAKPLQDMVIGGGSEHPCGHIENSDIGEGQEQHPKDRVRVHPERFFWEPITFREWAPRRVAQEPVDGGGKRRDGDPSQNVVE